jgi:hypothetical protein
MLTTAQLHSYPAVQLFVERAGSRGTDFKLSDDDASAVTEICRKLDGVPLAIELAAMRAAIFGLKDTAARLGSRLDLLKFGRRTANPRHRTLRATLDWSHDHLSEVERLVLRRVAIFIGSFTLDTAVAIVQEEGINQNDVAEAIESLVDKSMIEAGVDTYETSYRLLDTTRTYALEKLLHRGEHDAISTRHANFELSLNFGDGRPPDFDKSTLDHAGKYTFCVAENEADSPFAPGETVLDVGIGERSNGRVRLGYYRPVRREVVGRLHHGNRSKSRKNQSEQDGGGQQCFWECGSRHDRLRNSNPLAARQCYAHHSVGPAE